MQCTNINEIINNIPKSRFTTLQHAAEISKFVTERTIGPDKPIWEHKVDEDEQEDSDGIYESIEKYMHTPSGRKSEIDEKCSIKTPETEKKQQKTSTPKDEAIESSPPSLQNLDFQTINSSLLLRDAEQQRRKSIRQQVIDMQQRHLAVTQRSAEQERQLQKECDDWIVKKQINDALIIQEAERLAIKELEEYERQIEGFRKQTESQLVLISFQGVSQYQKKFRAKYEIVVNLLMSIDKQELLSCTEYNNKLRELIQMFDKLIVTLRTGICGTTELKSAESLCRSLDELERKVILELENIIKREQEKTELYNAEQKKIEEQQLQLQQNQPISIVESTLAPVSFPTAMPTNISNVNQVTDSPTPTSYSTTTHQSPNTQLASVPVTTSEATYKNASPERLEFYTQIISIYQDKVEKVKPLQSDANMKKYRFACQKAINTPVNAISDVSPQFLQDKFEKLYTFFAGQTFKTTEGNITINDHPLGRDYCVLLMAKKFVSQGDTAISSNPQAAFPFASVIVSLWKLIPEFGQIYLAYTFKESPFLVPYFIPHQSGQSAEEYYKMCGYRVTNGQVEDQDKYLKRQAGIARLYAAVMITSGRQVDGNVHPYGIEYAWRWLTNIINLEPLPDICATLLLEMLQIFGANLLEVYGKQFIKLLFYIQQFYFPKLSAVDEGGPKARLELLLGKYLTEGAIPKAKGVLPLGFW